jgi:peptidyl-prolyl cis-trans isomerase D
LITRTYGDFLPRLGTTPELAEAAFTLSKEKPVADKVYEIEGKFVVAALKEHQEPDLTGLSDSIRETLKAAVLTRKKDQIYSEKLKMLKEQSIIVVSPTIQASIEKEK